MMTEYGRRQKREFSRQASEGRGTTKGLQSNGRLDNQQTTNDTAMDDIVVDDDV
jgi:hypothetical protein